MGVGLVDEVVPAETVLAIVERISGPHEVMRFPASHTGTEDELAWRRFEHRLLELAAKGVPPGFGRHLRGITMSRSFEPLLPGPTCGTADGGCR